MNRSVTIARWVLALAAALAPVPVFSQDFPEVRRVRIGEPAEHSAVPSARRQGTFLPPQSVSAVDVSADGQSIAVATMAFRHDRNVFRLSADGKILGGRHVAPWAPFQIAALPGGKALAVGLAYSRVTAPHPTVSLLSGDVEETPLVDSAGDLGFLRYGDGDWRTGWDVSLVGDLIAAGGDFAVTVPHHDGARRFAADGTNTKFPLNGERPFRMAIGGGGKLLALGFLVPAGSEALRKAARSRPGLSVLSVRSTADGKDLWKVAPLDDRAAPAEPPRPEDDFPELAGFFDTRAAASVPFRFAASVSAESGSGRVAFTEYAGRMRVRSGPASGRWDPPYRIIPIAARQRGVLRVYSAGGRELARVNLPAEGLFEVHSDTEVWCAPMSWFARGAAGCAWLPTDAGARTVYRFHPERRTWDAFSFPDAIADVAVHGGKALVSCWDGVIYRLDEEGRVFGKVGAGGPCRLKWSPDGTFAVAGAHNGDVLILTPNAELRRLVRLPTAELPALKAAPKTVFDGLPIYQVGRTGPEHAYVGDTWLVKNGDGGFLVDAGGASSIPFTLQRIRDAGVDPKNVTHLVHTHSHGDHAGAGYLWRTMGLKVTAPATAEIALNWLMPTLSDYGVWVPRPVDVPLPLRKPGDEAEIEIAGVKVRAILVAGHSMDAAVYAMELNGRRVVFTGDIGFVDAAGSHVLHRCWGDVAKAKVAVEIMRSKVLPFRPEFVFTGHGAQRDGEKFLAELLRRSDEAIAKAAK
jgi:glyoxylase-like metal-dependent hydrolase (beta-lactamase superfamily II)